MSIKGAPVTLWLDGKSVTVFPIDAQGWRENGWGEDPETVTPPVEVVPDGADSAESEQGDGEGESAPPEGSAVATPAASRKART